MEDDNNDTTVTSTFAIMDNDNQLGNHELPAHEEIKSTREKSELIGDRNDNPNLSTASNSKLDDDRIVLSNVESSPSPTHSIDSHLKFPDGTNIVTVNQDMKVPTPPSPMNIINTQSDIQSISSLNRQSTSSTINATAGINSKTQRNLQSTSPPQVLSSTISGEIPGAYRVLPLHLRAGEERSSDSSDESSSFHDDGRNQSSAAMVMPVFSADLIDETSNQNRQTSNANDDIILADAQIMHQGWRHIWRLVLLLLLLVLVAVAVGVPLTMTRSQKNDSVAPKPIATSPILQSFYVVLFQPTSDCPTSSSSSPPNADQLLFTCHSGNEVQILVSSEGWYCGQWHTSASSWMCLRTEMSTSPLPLGETVLAYRPNNATLYTSAFVIMCSGSNPNAGVSVSILSRNRTVCVPSNASTQSPPPHSLYWTVLATFCESTDPQRLDIQYTASNYSGSTLIKLNGSDHQAFYYQRNMCPDSLLQCPLLSYNASTIAECQQCSIVSNATILSTGTDVSVCKPPAKNKVMAGGSYFFNQMRMQDFSISNIWAAMNDALY
jgi:hypothetical protein